MVTESNFIHGIRNKRDCRYYTTWAVKKGILNYVDVQNGMHLLLLCYRSGFHFTRFIFLGVGSHTKYIFDLRPVQIIQFFPHVD